ncbi:MAG: Transcriptional regulator, GntR family domain / Aspartate aminotransferase [Firmicutes bacterium]|nr:Transcriptional regulator, GntR family domain / Aspartate aminotransferase [Bacillota bacterium]MDI6706202.1 PLP-dependent aminotransferase family protein [Bacillota bacterium]
MKYLNIIEYIEKLAASDRLRQGDRLPSIRAVADRFGCNKSTVVRAYRELELNHRVYTIPKSGFYLVGNNNPESKDKFGAIDFSTAMPDPKLLPYREFNHSINKAIEMYKQELFSYNDAQGLKSLREVMVRFFSDYQIFTTAEKIFITSGSQQGLSILSGMSFPNGRKNILVEQPTYGEMLRWLELNKYPVVGIDRDENGIDFNELEKLFKHGDIKFFYTIPRLHNPLGTGYSEKEKMKIVELAEKYDVYIVEDDYLGDLDTNKKALPLHYYDIDERVIHVRSFSKSFMPGIRIGAVILKEQLKTEFLKFKRCNDLNTSVLAQGSLEIFINSGMYNSHVKKAQLEYRKKMNCLRENIRRIDTKAMVPFIPETGFFVWIKLPETMNMDKYVNRLKERKIYVSPSESFYIEQKAKQKAIRICISRLTKEDIGSGIQILFEEMNRLID